MWIGIEPFHNHEHLLASHVSELPWKQIHKSVGDCSLGQHLDSSERLWARNAQLSRSQSPDMHKMWELINDYYCLNPLNFRVICHTAIDDKKIKIYYTLGVKIMTAVHWLIDLWNRIGNPEKNPSLKSDLWQNYHYCKIIRKELRIFNGKI